MYLILNFVDRSASALTIEMCNVMNGRCTGLVPPRLDQKACLKLPGMTSANNHDFGHYYAQHEMLQMAHMRSCAARKQSC